VTQPDRRWLRDTTLHLHNPRILAQPFGVVPQTQTAPDETLAQLRNLLKLQMMTRDTVTKALVWLRLCVWHKTVVIVCRNRRYRVQKPSLSCAEVPFKRFVFNGVPNLIDSIESMGPWFRLGSTRPLLRSGEGARKRLRHERIPKQLTP
jgi:hypothetical protein